MRRSRNLSDPTPKLAQVTTTLSHIHDSQTWLIPADLIQVQRDFDTANDDCHRLADSDDTSAYQAARRRRMDAVLALHRHPWLNVEHKAQRGAADRALKDYARAKQAAAG